jgi:hypothetical protein
MQANMFCPQCGIESPSGLQYCRSCGANLKVIGKALTLSEAIARSDRGPLPKLKEMVKSIKIDQVTEEVSRALDRMNKEIVSHTPKDKPDGPWWKKRKKTARERREEQFTKGAISFFSGIGLTIFLYFLSGALVLKIPPDIVQKIPFEIEPLISILWWIGFMPMTAGIGHFAAGLLIRRDGEENVAQCLESGPRHSNVREFAPASQSANDWSSEPAAGVSSVTERTTNLLEVRGPNTARQIDEER